MTEKTSLDESAMQALQVQIASLLQEQAELLDEARYRMEAWTRRRRDAVQVSCRTLCGRRDAEALAASYAASYGDRLVARMNRVMADIADARNEALRSAESVQRLLEPPPREPATLAGALETLSGGWRATAGTPSRQ